MDKSEDSVHLFDTVALILRRMNSDVEKYIEVSLSEGLRVELYVVEKDIPQGDEPLSRELCGRIGDGQGAQGLLVITDDDGVAQELERLGVAVAGYRAPGCEYEGFATRYVVEELPMVDDEYFNLVYMRAHHIPVVIAQTERTIIREMTENDLPAMYELYADPAVARWCEPLYEYGKELEFTRAYIDNMYVFYGYGLWLVFDKENGELIGRAGISHREIDGIERCELGYIIKGTRQRQGLGFEVSREIIRYAADSLGMDELWLCTEEENEASEALAQKLGFYQWGSALCDIGSGEQRECRIYRKSPLR